MLLQEKYLNFITFCISLLYYANHENVCFHYEFTAADES